MSIYSSTKVLPYVYQLVHKETGQFYFGYRYANKVPSLEDLGTHYFTSSKIIKELGFENFDFLIIAEFFSRKEAALFEYDLIKNTWKEQKSLNKNISGIEFKSEKGKVFSKEYRLAISNAKRGKLTGPFPEERKLKMKRTNEQKEHQRLIHLGITHSKETKQKMSNTRLGMNLKENTKQKISKANTGKVRTPECINKMKEGLRGRKKMIHQNSLLIKIVKPDLIEEYLTDGWILAKP